MIFLKLEDVLRAHDKQIELFGGSFGVRDMGLLESAINMPSSTFGDEYLHEDIFLMAAACLFHISKNHPFVDGNKRTALHCMIIFLDVNDYELNADENEIEELAIDTATGKLSKDDISKFLRKKCEKRNN